MQQGQGKLGAIVWLAIFAITAMVGWEAIPVKMRSSELQDFMVEIAKFSANLEGERIQKEILTKARDLDIPLRKQDVQVQKSNGRIRMKCSYTIPLEFPFYTYQWDFHHDVDRPIFYI